GHDHGADTAGGARVPRPGRGWAVRRGPSAHARRLTPDEHRRRRAVPEPSGDARDLPDHRGRAAAPGRGRGATGEGREARRGERHRRVVLVDRHARAGDGVAEMPQLPRTATWHLPQPDLETQSYWDA